MLHESHVKKIPYWIATITLPTSPTNEDTATETNPTIQPHRLAQFRIPVRTSKEGVVVLHGGIIPYLKSSLNVTHAIQYWSYYAHILPGNNLSFFPALTEDNIQDFIDRLNLIQQEVLSIGKLLLKQKLSVHLIIADIQAEVSPLLAQNTLKN